MNHQKQIGNDLKIDNKQRNVLYRNAFIEKRIGFCRGNEVEMWVREAYLHGKGLL